MAGQQFAKRIPSIKFPNRRATAAGAAHAGSGAPKSSSSPQGSESVGPASIQPKRPPPSKEEIEAVLLGGALS